jgi:type IV pilus assembly protein PilM
MDEQSIWKKEISFRRKQKSKADKVPAAPGEEPKSVWKKEISFRRKSKPVATKTAANASAPTPRQSFLRKEITLGRKAKPEQAAKPPVRDSGPGEGVRGDRGVSPTNDAAQVEEPIREVEATVVARAEPVHTESWESEPEVPTAPEVPPAPEVPSEPELPAAAEEPTVEVASPPVELSPPTPGPAQPAPAPAPAPGVHPPVPAAELPPLAEERKEKPTPFWRREFVLGRRAPATSKVEAPVADTEPTAEQPENGKQPKPKKVRAPKIKAERGGKGKKLVGLKIGGSQLAVARVTNNGAAELLQVAREPLSPGIVVGGEVRDPDALSVALKDFFAKYKLPKRGVRLGIANNRIGVRTFEIGGIDDQKQLDNAIKFRAQEALPIPIDEAVLDYQVLGQTTNEDGETLQRILLVVAYREQIDRYVDACRKAGITLVGIDLEAFALLRALQAPQAGAGDDPDAALVAVAIGHERSTFAVSDGRVCEFTRVLEWGGQALNVTIARALDAAPSEVEAVKRTLSLADDTAPEGLTTEQATKARDAVRRAIQAFARELVSSLQFYQNQPGSLGIGEIVLTGGTTHLPGLAAELERLIGVHVRVGDPLARMRVSKKLQEPDQIGSYAVAIGLGIED